MSTTDNRSGDTSLLAPQLTVSGETGALVFSWEPVQGASNYRVYANADGHSGFEPLSGELPSDQLSYRQATPMHLTDWANAQYLVAACDRSGCVESSPVGAADAMLAGIGVLKGTRAEERFGFSFVLSADGRTLAAGARGETGGGAVYVFTKGEDGRWEEPDYLEATNPGAGDGFGTALAISADGKTLVVGAPNEDGAGAGVAASDNDGAQDAGAVYVFRRQAGGAWGVPVYLKASNAGSGDHFGFSLALSSDGRTLAAGAPDEDGGGAAVNPSANDAAAGAGAVYVFTRNEGDTWAAPVYLKAANPDADDTFGLSLALSADGGILAVSAPWEDGAGAGVNPAADNAAENAGALYVFVRDGAGTWAAPEYLKASNPGAGDRLGGAIQAPFGRSLAISADGQTLAVGAPFEDGSGGGVDPADNDNAPGAGAAYVFTRSGGSWSGPTYLKAANPDAYDAFGESFGGALALSADGQTLAVGAIREDGSGTGVNPADDNGIPDAGAVYVFSRDAGGAWTPPDYLKAADPGERQLFGYSLALSEDGSILAVGAPWEDGGGAGINPAADSGAADAGAVYVFRRDANEAWTAPVYVKSPEPVGYDLFGSTLGLSADGRTLAAGTARDPESRPDLSQLRNETIYLY